jgi:hypothetical protein
LFERAKTVRALDRAAAEKNLYHHKFIVAKRIALKNSAHSEIIFVLFSLIFVISKNISNTNYLLLLKYRICRLCQAFLLFLRRRAGFDKLPKLIDHIFSFKCKTLHYYIIYILALHVSAL